MAIFTLGSSLIESSAFVIRELTGQQRELRLIGARALPFRPLSFKGKQRAELTWLPGNPIATSTITGPTEEPTTINGYWKDKYLSAGDGSSTVTLDGVAITTVRELVKAVDSFRRLGQLMEVTWDEQARHGHMTEFEHQWHNVHDVEWEVTFEWTSQAEAQVPAVFAQLDLGNAFAKFRVGLSDLLEKTFPPLIGAALEFMNKIKNQIQRIVTAIVSIGSAISNGFQEAMTPFDIARRIVAACSEIIGAVKDLGSDLEDQTIMAVDLRRGDAALAFGTGRQKDPNLLGTQGAGQVVQSGRDFPQDRLSTGQRIVAYDYARGIKNSAREIMSNAIVTRAHLLKQVATDILSSYTAKDGDDLRDVSKIFYSTPFEWRRIMVFNELASAELEAGQLVLIPKLQTGLT